MRTVTVKKLDDLDILLAEVRKEFDTCGNVVVTIAKGTNRRSLSQNASLHLYCEQIADKMNAAGYTQRQLVGSFKEGFELPTTGSMIKDIFRAVCEAMYQKKSTADLTTVEIQKVYQVVDERFGQITGCRAEWPSSEPPIEAYK